MIVSVAEQSRSSGCRPSPVPRGRPWISIALAVLLAAGAAGYATWNVVAPTGARCASTLAPLAELQLRRLQQFEGWLARNHAAGYVGEVGWPGDGGDADQWNAVAQAWYRAADEDQLWVTAWSAGLGWPASYPMAIYRLSDDPSRPGVSGPQAAVIEQHTDPGSALRGVNIPTGAFGANHDATSRYSDLEPGRYGRDYYYPTANAYRFLAAHGVRIVRLAVTWERIQPTPFGRLSHSELRHLTQSLYDAKTAGVGVVLDLHNFGARWHATSRAQYPQRVPLGSPGLPTNALADLWSRLARALRSVPDITAYDLMNEPGHLARSPQVGAAMWERASQQAVTAIRAAHDARVIAVEAYGPSGPEQFTELHRRAWIHDPLGLTRYEMHQYFDAGGSGRYRRTLPVEAHLATTRAIAGGWYRQIPDNLACVSA